MFKIFKLIPILKRIMPIAEEVGSTKGWWKSETIWVNIGAAAVALGGMFGMDMAGIDVGGTIGPLFAGLMAVFNILQRFATKTAIGGN